MSRVTGVDLVGDEKLAALFAKAKSAGMLKALGKATYATGSNVLNKSQKIVPVDVGTLKNSGAVSKPKETPTGVEVEISYGGKARSYAFIVHEDPSAQHKDGKTYHYLKIPVDAARDKFVTDVKKRFLAYLRVDL
jgi:hypothetical protein